MRAERRILDRERGRRSRRPRRGWCAFVVLLVGASLTGCGPRRQDPAPVGELSIRGSATQGVHAVQSGDTLYSIAFRYGVDFRDLAQWNGIGEPYTIFVGQQVRLEPLTSAAVPADAPTVSQGPARPEVETRAVPVAEARRSVSAAPTRPAASPIGAKTVPKTVAPSQTPAKAATSAESRTKPRAAENKKSASGSRKETSYTQGPVRWQWPTTGPILKTFSTRETGRKGVDIGGKIGEPVRAAAGGKVVYSGSGLVGYGKLIIVKHNDEYLSAYAHNSELLVAEGQNVNAGETIARKGAAGKQPQLHFEIRRNGKPVNPLGFLPKR